MTTNLELERNQTDCTISPSMTGYTTNSVFSAGTHENLKDAHQVFWWRRKGTYIEKIQGTANEYSYHCSPLDY